MHPALLNCCLLAHLLHRTEVHFHSEGGTLELEDLPDQSTLDT